MSEKKLAFPEGFLWGTATAGHQIEGHNDKSDWWQFEQEGKTLDGTKSGAAVDYWNRYEEDHALMNELGYPAFRLGVEWAKIEPEDGVISREAIERYKNILASLRSRNIKICLTIYHWVLPMWFAKKGGWLWDKAVKRFVKFAEIVVKELGEYPDMWVTLNEPTVPTSAGYFAGVFPPEKKSIPEFLSATKALMKSHYRIYELIHNVVPGAPDGGPTIAGIATAYQDVKPYGSPGLAGMYEKTLSRLYKYFSFKAWDNVLTKDGLPFPLNDSELKNLKDTVDFAGVNYYTRYCPRFDATKTDQMFIDVFKVPEGSQITQMGWEIHPPGFYNVLMDVWKTFGKPIYITENGIADDTDEMRPSYTLEHLAQVHRAIGSGADIQGYYHWSFTDNFEWKEGFSKRFGLIAVDHDDPKLERKPRPAARMYSKIIAENAISESLVDQYAPKIKSNVFDAANWKNIKY